MRNGTRENLQTQRLMAQLRGCGSRVYGKPQAFAGNIGTTGPRPQPRGSSPPAVPHHTNTALEEVWLNRQRVDTRSRCSAWDAGLLSPNAVRAVPATVSSLKMLGPDRYYSSFAGPRICPRISPAGAFVVWTLA
jgi:hypothetical protein